MGIQRTFFLVKGETATALRFWSVNWKLLNTALVNAQLLMWFLDYFKFLKQYDDMAKILGVKSGNTQPANIVPTDARFEFNNLKNHPATQPRPPPLLGIVTDS